MTPPRPPKAAPVVRLSGVSLYYGKVRALNDVSLDLPTGCLTGIIGPDGVGKSTLFSLISGARAIQGGSVEVLGGDMADAGHRNKICPRIAYMPQGLGKNLYPTLSVFENVDFFARLFGHAKLERRQRIGALLDATGLSPFADRAVGKLSGGMKQKLGLCCALIHDPELLILDEPTTGVDPLSRRQFWELIDRIRGSRSNMSVLVATAYMEEAARFDWLITMNEGEVLSAGSPQDLLAQTDSRSLDEAFVKQLPAEQREGYQPVVVRGRAADEVPEVAIEARDLTMRFGAFTAVDRVDFSVRQGEIFGFVGSNGCGKTTTMKMLTGLLPPSEGQAWLFGQLLDPRDLATRRRVGYMTQSFSLHTELTVRQNLVLNARLFGMPEDRIPARTQEMARRFGLADIIDSFPDALPLGKRQRLSLAVAMIHGPEMLILDEPTSGVDPVARDGFWNVLIELARKDNVTIFISTHLMSEAERCDRISLMHAGRVLVTDSPKAIMESRGSPDLEEAFVGYLEEEVSRSAPETAKGAEAQPRTGAILEPVSGARTPGRRGPRHLRRLLSYARREALELRRDPIRLTLALLGSVFLMLVLGYGVSLDVENLSFAVLDQDQTTMSRDYVLNLAGSRYFTERPPIRNYADLDKRMRAGKLSLAIEIPSGFARDIARGTPVQIGAWVDGAMPTRAETVEGYVLAMQQHWLAAQVRKSSYPGAGSSLVNIETRFRYNPDVKSLPAMVPAAIPILLMMIPAMLAALSVVREKELGSIVNFYVTPVSPLEFLLGKQIPYIALAMASFLLLVALAIFVLGVPLKGSFVALTTAALLYVSAATALGLVMSAFTRSQIAALFGTALLTILPAIEYCGLINPVSSLQGLGRVIGEIYPTTHFLVIARGTFSKGLDLSELGASFIPLLIAVPVLVGLGTLLLRKQER